MIHKSVVAAQTHNFVSGVFVTYLGFFEGIIWGFTKNLSGSIDYHIVAIAVEEAGVFASAATFGMEFEIGLTLRGSR